MPDSVKDSPLYSLINPRSIVFFGASNRFSSMGTNQLSSVLDFGFAGKIYPVHPSEKTVLGLKAYRRVLDLAEIPDLAILVLPTNIVSGILQQCGQKGIRQAIIVSGGFKEVNRRGVRLEQELIQTARKYGMRFLGPNCLGIANAHHKLNTTFLPHQGVPGFVGMASQSGSYITQMFDYLSRSGLGFSTAVSVGNEADIDIVECMQYLARCPHTKVICLYIESIRNGRRFLDAARNITPHKPVVAYYVGGSEPGRRASLSHTGALSGPDRLYDGVFKQCGIIRADSIEEMFDFCSVLGRVRPPKGNKVVIQTHSGGPGATAADACGREGLRVPAMPKTIAAKLAPFVPPTGSTGNPVDITFSKDPLEYFSKIPDCLLAGDSYDMLLIYVLTSARLFRRHMADMGIAEDEMKEMANRFVDGICDSIQMQGTTNQKPIIGFSFHARQEYIIKALHKRNIPVLPDPKRAARAAAALWKYAVWRKRL